MRPIEDRTVIENLPLGECAKGDEIDISYSHNGSWKSIGQGTIEKIKALPKGGHQIKFRHSWRGSNVQKHDVPAGVVVERRRAPTPAELEADPSLAPKPEQQTAVREGVRYVATDPAIDLEAALDDAMTRRGVMPVNLTEQHLALGLGALDIAAASLGLAALFSGGALRRVD